MKPEAKRKIAWICERLEDAQITNHQYLAEDAKGALEDCVAAIEKREKWIADLQSGMYVNCIYCGHRYGPSTDTPTSMADVLKAHAEQCAAHPLAEASKTIEHLSELLLDIKEEKRALGEQALADGRIRGLEEAAKWIDQLRDDYIAEHGSCDPETGVTEFPGNGNEYVVELEEIAEGIRALKFPASPEVK